MVSLQAKLQPVLNDTKIGHNVKSKENKASVINKQYVVYKFQCNLYDWNYVGYATRHLTQRIQDHIYSAFGKHLASHNTDTKTP